ncbi:MAG: hypothetical protein P8176_07605 [Gammaproteobacteria bacterium]
MPNSISTVSGYPGVLALTQKYAVSPAYRRLKQLQLSDITNRLPRAKTAAQHSATAALSLGLGIGIGMLIANRDKVHDFNKKIGPALGHHRFCKTQSPLQTILRFTAWFTGQKRWHRRVENGDTGTDSCIKSQQLGFGDCAHRQKN